MMKALSEKLFGNVTENVFEIHSNIAFSSWQLLFYEIIRMNMEIPMSVWTFVLVEYPRFSLSMQKNETKKSRIRI